MRYIVIFILFVVSCKSDTNLQIVHDTWKYKSREYRIDKDIKGEIYNLSRRYFVFNYSSNKNNFDSLATEFLCNSLNDSLLVSNLYFDFQDMGYLGGRYEEGSILSADFTTNLVYFKWSINKPYIIETKWGEFNGQIKTIKCNCNLKDEYNKYLWK